MEKTCENCKWATPLHDNEKLCGSPEVHAMIYTYPKATRVEIVVETDFGCNEWEEEGAGNE